MAQEILLAPAWRKSPGFTVESGWQHFAVVTDSVRVRWGYRRPALLGTLIVITALVVLALRLQATRVTGFRLGATPLPFGVVRLAGIGHATCTPAANVRIETTPGKMAAITGLRAVFRILGSAFGISVATVVVMPASADVTISRARPAKPGA